METIYFFAVDEKYEDEIKIGETRDIIKRLETYNTGRIKEVDLKYLALVKNAKLIENCMQLKMKKYQVFKYKEIYKVDPEYIKNVINECYCENVTKEEDDELYEEIGELTKLYGYIRNKKVIHPYIIINVKEKSIQNK